MKIKKFLNSVKKFLNSKIKYTFYEDSTKQKELNGIDEDGIEYYTQHIKTLYQKVPFTVYQKHLWTFSKEDWDYLLSLFKKFFKFISNIIYNCRGKQKGNAS